MNTLVSNRTLLSRWVKRATYWAAAALLLFFVFSNRSYDISIRALVVAVLVLMSFGLTQFINQFLVPKYLFTGRHFLFGYLVLATFIASIWVNLSCIIAIIWFTLKTQTGIALPTVSDLILLVSGSYLVILFATFVHFIKETFARQQERDRIARQKTETDLKLQEARLQLLQGQLHPHFLFNMLNNLYGLWMEKSGQTPEVILKLSSLLDYMLYECNQEKISLSKEVDFIQNYVDLESIRHDARLRLELDFPKTPQDILIAPLLLFVLVENAFKHGVYRNSGVSHISVSLSITSSMLNFVVRNNFKKSNSANPGIGLLNLRERLNLLYPSRHTLNVSRCDEVFTASLQIDLNYQQ
ncbi:MAG: histidine kinase [Tenuifilaceae bacterium]|jgi:sensor histidine kinase YesM|nr:histidine kinase [Tenuifilaceae bacterium]